MAKYIVSEADEACITPEHAIKALFAIAADEGPGNLTDLYERAAWTIGVSRDVTTETIRRALTPPGGLSLDEALLRLRQSVMDYSGSCASGEFHRCHRAARELGATPAQIFAALDR